MRNAGKQEEEGELGEGERRGKKREVDEGLVGAGDFEAGGGVAIPVWGGHAADGVEVGLDDAAGGGVVEGGVEAEVVDDAEDDAVVADFLDGVDAAFEGGGGVGDAWWGDGEGGGGFDVSGGGFAGAVGEWGGGGDHGGGEGFVEEVDDEFAGAAAVECGVFGCAVFAIAGGEDDEGRVIAEDVEEGEGCGVDGAVLIEGGDPGDGARGDEGGEKGVGAVGVGAEEVEVGGHGRGLMRTERKATRSLWSWRAMWPEG